MGLAHHCVYLNSHSYIISEIRQYPKVVANFWFADHPRIRSVGTQPRFSGTDLDTLLLRPVSETGKSLLTSFRFCGCG